MDHQGMDLKELIDKIKVELKNALYSDSYVLGLCTIWNRLRDYMLHNGKTIFTAKVGMDFLETEYGITVYRKLDSVKKSIVPELSIYL